MISQDLLATVRRDLEGERDGLRDQLAELGSGDDSELAFDENFADSGQVAAEQGEVKMLAASLQEQLEGVERALHKIDEGTYGRCEVCGEPIPDARLEAMPAVRFCIQHADG